MVIPAQRPAPAPSLRSLRWRVLVWALMLAAVGWTIAYRAGKGREGVPEFVYVNF